MSESSTRTAPPAVSLGEAFWFWLKLGLISFGGPAGQIAIMHQELVEKRRWLSERRFLHALNYCMLLPGPEAQQLATYIGWLMHRTWGGVIAGVLFVLPSLFILIGLSWVYIAFGDVPLVAGIFYGIKPAVTAIVMQAAWRIGSRALKNNVLWALAAASFVAIFVFHLSECLAGNKTERALERHLRRNRPQTTLTSHHQSGGTLEMEPWFRLAGCIFLHFSVRGEAHHCSLDRAQGFLAQTLHFRQRDAALQCA